MNKGNQKPPKYVLPPFFITEISPAYLKNMSGLPVLAIFHGKGTLRRTPASPHLFAAATLFLIGDENGKFKWISPGDYVLHEPRSRSFDYLSDRKKLPWGDKGQFSEENEAMIIPVMPFSITKVSLDGFDPSKGYPVLAMDTEKIWQENQESAEEETAGPTNPGKQVSMAFFLVADDDGNFAWIAEDECSLYPLENEN
jgi:hypothetical protein